MEIVAVNAQRKELESQRELIQFQRKQLADMLKQAEALVSAQRACRRERQRLIRSWSKTRVPLCRSGR